MSSGEYGYTMNDAMKVAADCKRIYKMMGVQAAYPYHDWQIVRSMLTIVENAPLDAIPRADHFKLKRQFNVLKARYAKLAKKHGAKVEDDIDDTADVAYESES
jgi:hypothetical protein